MLPIKFWLNPTRFGRKCHLKNGSHLGYWKRTILATLNLYNAPMPPIKFQFNLTYGLGDVIWRISKWPLWWPSWISEWNDFSNSESLCHCDASHQVLAQSNLQFGKRRHLKNFKMAAMVATLDIGTEQFQQFWISTSLWCLPSSFGSFWLIVWEEIFWISERNYYSNSESLCHCDAFHQVLAQSDLQFGRRCHLKNFKMATMTAILDIRMERF